jgi:imidazolonepropionase-like amidohydrolase
MENAPPFIKFALGENVKQSNWGDNFVTRYPQTRLGVEQIYRDEFQTAKDYKAVWDRFAAAGGAKSNTVPPRKDLELEAILEILNGQRNITCHSYVQSEITMLMRVAEQMGFKVNTFTHILEGYKVADKMKLHGAAVSTFSDWWAYKYEVYDAIPYNGAIMHDQGLTVAYNSDDAEMARRLNQEAAKAVKYGGVSEEEAWKFVTLNPATMLHINDRVGSIKPGMDADIVLWNDHPLSIYAKPLQTYVDGRLYFDTEKDHRSRLEMAQERTRLIQKMIDEKKGGAPVTRPMGKGKWRYHCDTMDSDYNKIEN